METVLLVIHLMLAVALICVVLLQRSAQEGGGLTGGGTMGGLFTARGSANLLTRTTAILATCFIAMSLILGVMASRSHDKRSLVEQIAPAAPKAETPDKAPAPETGSPAPMTPEVPVSR